jgi:Ca2+/Na+ antiporter
MIVVFHSILLLLLFWILAVVCDVVFVPSLEKIAKKRNMSAEFAWATLMAVWSSAPELFTAIFALTKWAENISLWAGTIVWSALFNILVIIWASAMISKIKLSRKPVIRDLGMYILAIILLLLTFMDGQIFLREVIFYVCFYIIYIFIAKNRSKRLKYKNEFANEDEESLSDLNHRVHRILTWWEFFKRFMEAEQELFRKFRKLNEYKRSESVDDGEFQKIGKKTENHIFIYEGKLTERMFKQEKWLDKVIDSFYKLVYCVFPFYNNIK